MSAEELAQKKTRFYRSLELKLVAWTFLALGLGLALALPSVALAVASMGGMLIILRLAMKDPVYVHLRASKKTTS
jgi:hypothetical protein